MHQLSESKTLEYNADLHCLEKHFVELNRDRDFGKRRIADGEALVEEITPGQRYYFTIVMKPR